VAAEKLKARKAVSRERTMVYLLLAVVVALVLIVGILLLQSPLFKEPTAVDLAYQELLAGVEQNPDDAGLLMSLAEIEWELKKRGDAIEHAERALAAGKDVPGIGWRYAMLMIKADQADRAGAALEAEVALNPDNMDALFLLGQVKRENGDLEGAAEALKEVLKVRYYDADARIVYAGVLAQMGDKEGAIKEYEAARRYLPDDPRILQGLKDLGETVEETVTVDPHGSTEPAAQ
jgi:predicted Zn-dependent protease